MKYYIGYDSLTGEIKSTVNCGDNWPVQAQADLDGLTYEEVTQTEFGQAYPSPALFKWDNVNKRVIANDLFPTGVGFENIIIPDSVEFDDSVPIPNHVTVRRPNGNIVRQGIDVIAIQ